MLRELFCLLTIMPLVAGGEGDILDLLGDKFILPESTVEVDVAECAGAAVYNSEAALAEIDTEEEYLCAFVAFQLNKVEGVGIPPYGDVAEATMRYELFKQCVEDVKQINSDTDDWEAGVNFFCDMTLEEKLPYTDSHPDGDDNPAGGGLGSGPGMDISNGYDEADQLVPSAAVRGVTSSNVYLMTLTSLLLITALLAHPF